MPSLKIDIIVDDKGRPVIDRVSGSMKNLAASTNQADKALKNKTATVDQSGSSMAGLTRTILRLYAAYYVVSQGIQGMTGLLMQGVKAIDDYNLSIAKMAAMMTGMMVPNGKGLAEQYQEARAYAEQLNVMIERVDKNTLLTASDLRQITEEMLKQGVVVDTNNKKQVEAFTNISNALAVIAQGSPNKEIQYRQEIRALLTGQKRDTDQLSKMLNAQTGDLKEQIELHRKQGDLIEWLGEQLRGFAAAQGDINASWEATKTTLQTIYEQILRAGFQTAFRDINQSVRDLSEWAIQHKSQIAEILEKGYAYIKIAWYDIKNFATNVYNILEGYKPLLITITTLTGGLADSFGGVQAALIPISKLLGTILGGYLELVTAIVRFNPAAIAARLTLGESFGDIWKDAKDTVERGKGIVTNLNGPKVGDIGKGVDARRQYIDETMGNLLGSSYDISGWGNATKPDLKLPPGDGKGAEKYANALRQITDETTAWMHKIEEMNPHLEKEDSAILKLTNDAEELIKRITDQGQKAGVATAGFIAKIREGLEVGIGFAIDKERKKLYEEYEKLLFDEVEYGMTENERAANQIIHKAEEKLARLAEMWAKGAFIDPVTGVENVEKVYDLWIKIEDNKNAALLDKETENAKKIADINYNLIQGIAGMQEWAYELRLQQIDAEAAKYAKDGAAPQAIEAWKEYQRQLAAIQKAITNNNFFEGFAAQARKHVLDMRSAGQYGAEGFIGAHAAIRDSFSDLFSDLRNGELKSFGEYMLDFTKKIIAVWDNMLAEMLANWIMTGQAMRSADTSTAAMGGIGGLLGWMFGKESPSYGVGGDWGTWGGTFGDYQVAVGHGGGVMGYDKFNTRTVPGSVFANAPRFHGGIGPGERAAIIRNDEGVFTPGQMKALGKGGSGTVVNINLENPVFQDLETQQKTMAQIAEIVAKKVAPGAVVENYKNDGEIRSMVKGRA